MEAKMEPENQDFDDLNMKGDNPPPYEARGQNPHHVGYDQPSDPRGYNLPQHSLPMQTTNSTVVTVQPVPTCQVVGPKRGVDLSLPAVCICFFFCWITGFAAILCATQAQDLYEKGEIEEGNKKQRWAWILMIASVILCVIIIAVNVVIMKTSMEQGP